jgi:hypothetical protein
MVNWPDWWHCELELSAHLFKRMRDREFNEADLRLMMADAFAYHPDYDPDRWTVQTRLGQRLWEVIVEPIPHE